MNKIYIALLCGYDQALLRSA